MKRLMVLLVVTALLVNGKTINAQSIQDSKKKIGVVVTILPLADFVENIGKDKVDVSVMIPPGGNPHTYEPTPSQLKQVSQAQMYVKVGSGVEFELAWMDKLASLNKNMLICDSSEGIRLIEMTEHHHEENEGHHRGRDPHIWLSPVNAMLMVTSIKNALIEIDSGNKEFYTHNAQEFILRLDNLNKEFGDKLSALKNRSFVVFHPAWGYFAADYGLKQIPIEVEGKEPTAKELTQLIKEAKKCNIKVVFSSPQFSKKSAEVIAKEINGKVVFMDPLAKNYIENLHKVVDAFTQSLK
ncbi:MAG: zinc ABC transporter substrate-binding protein [bacterium]|nr:zinc ABC transporter substrate-binding protein [bacterium]